MERKRERGERRDEWHVERERETCHETRERERPLTRERATADKREREREKVARECEGLVRVLI